MTIDITKEYDIAFENIRCDYALKGGRITDENAVTLNELRRKFEKKNFKLPLVPYYLEHLLKCFEEVLETGGDVHQDFSMFENSHNVLSSNSLAGFISRDPIIGGYFFSMSKKLFFRNYPEIRYKKVFEELGIDEVRDLFLLTFSNTSLFNGYVDSNRFRYNWEFSSLGALCSTYLCNAIDYNESQRESLFLQILFKDIGKAVLYNELPFFSGSTTQRYLKGHPQLKIDTELFDCILWHLHPVISAQIVMNWDTQFEIDIAPDMLVHHQEVEEGTIDLPTSVRLHKFLNTFLDEGIYQLTKEKMITTCRQLSLDIKDGDIDQLIKELQSIRLENMSQSLIDPEAGTVSLVSTYDNLDEKNHAGFVTEDNIYFAVNMLQMMKDKKLGFYRDYFFNITEESFDEHTDRIKRIVILNAVYNSETLEEAAKELKMTVKKLEDKIEKIQITLSDV